MLILTAAAARADLPPPPGTRYVDVAHQIETETPLNEYMVLVQYGGMRNDVEEVWIGPSRPFELTGGSRDTARLIIVPRRAVPGQTPREITANPDTIPGSLTAAFVFRDTESGITGDTKTVVVHRIRRKVDGTLEMIRISSIEGGVIPAVAIPAAIAVGTVLLMWFILRRGRC